MAFKDIRFASKSQVLKLLSQKKIIIIIMIIIKLLLFKTGLINSWVVP